MGFVRTDGRWGIARRDYYTPVTSEHAELLAVALLLKRDHTGLPDVVLLDNQSACNYLTAWQRGETGRMPRSTDRMPRDWHAAANPEKPTLARLADRVSGLAGVRFEWVKGHAGHLLNEAADALASIAMENISSKTARHRAERLVGGFLAQINDGVQH